MNILGGDFGGRFRAFLKLDSGNQLVSIFLCPAMFEQVVIREEAIASVSTIAPPSGRSQPVVKVTLLDGRSITAECTRPEYLVLIPVENSEDPEEIDSLVYVKSASTFDRLATLVLMVVVLFFFVAILRGCLV